MKKTLILSLLILIGSSVCLFAGGGTESKVKGTVYYLSPNQFDEFQTTASKLIGGYVAEEGYKYEELVAGNEDVTLQLNQLDNVIALKPEAIILQPVDSVAIVDGVEKARAAGIPVISFERTISETKVDFSSVAGSFRMGVLGGQETARLLKERYGEVKGRVLSIMGAATDSFSINVEEGFRSVMKEYPNVIIETKVSGQWDATVAANTADDYLLAYPDTDLIFCGGDFLGAAIVPILESKGIEKGEIMLITQGGMPMALDLIREGWAQSVVEQPLFAQCKGATFLLDEIIAGKKIEPEEYTVAGITGKVIEQPYGLELQVPGNAITAENVDDPKWWANQVE